MALMPWSCLLPYEASSGVVLTDRRGGPCTLVSNAQSILFPISSVLCSSLCMTLCLGFVSQRSLRGTKPAQVYAALFGFVATKSGGWVFEKGVEMQKRTILLIDLVW